MSTTLSIFVVPALWLISSAVCFVVCRLRNIQATAVQCFIIGGLPLALGAIPLPLPYLMLVAIWYAITVYVTMKYLGVALFPDGMLIPFATQGAGIAIPLLLDVILRR